VAETCVYTLVSSTSVITETKEESFNREIKSVVTGGRTSRNDYGSMM